MTCECIAAWCLSLYELSIMCAKRDISFWYSLGSRREHYELNALTSLQLDTFHRLLTAVGHHTALHLP